MDEFGSMEKPTKQSQTHEISNYKSIIKHPLSMFALCLCGCGGVTTKTNGCLFCSANNRKNTPKKKLKIKQKQIIVHFWYATAQTKKTTEGFGFI